MYRYAGSRQVSSNFLFVLIYLRRARTGRSVVSIWLRRARTVRSVVDSLLRIAFAGYELVICQWPPLAGPMRLIWPDSFSLLMLVSILRTEIPNCFANIFADINGSFRIQSNINNWLSDNFSPTFSPTLVGIIFWLLSSANTVTTKPSEIFWGLGSGSFSCLN